MRLAAAIAFWTCGGAPAGATASPLGSSSADWPSAVGAGPVPPPALVLVSPDPPSPEPAPVPPDCASAGAGVSAKTAIVATSAAIRPCRFPNEVLGYGISGCSVQPSFVGLRG
jgi:hypothetical protein